jgi:hypothetical protein
MKVGRCRVPGRVHVKNTLPRCKLGRNSRRLFFMTQPKFYDMDVTAKAGEEAGKEQNPSGIAEPIKRPSNLGDGIPC